MEVSKMSGSQDALITLPIESQKQNSLLTFIYQGDFYNCSFLNVCVCLFVCEGSSDSLIWSFVLHILTTQFSVNFDKQLWSSLCVWNGFIYIRTRFVPFKTCYYQQQNIKEPIGLFLWLGRDNERWNTTPHPLSPALNRLYVEKAAGSFAMALLIGNDEFSDSLLSFIIFLRFIFCFGLFKAKLQSSKSIDHFW